MKRLLLSIHITICLAMLLTACGTSGFGISATPEPASISFSVPYEYQAYYTTQIAEFRKQEPKIMVEIKGSNASGSEDADVIVSLWSDAFGRAGDRLANGLDLTPFLEQGKGFNRADYYPGLLDAFTRDGKLRGLPTGVNPFVILYNQDLFDKYGVPYPKPGWTWDDFKTTAMQLRDPVAKTYGYIPADSYVDCMFFVYQHGGSLLKDGKSPSLDSPEAIEALEWYGKLFGVDGVAPTDAQAQKDFIGQGQVGVSKGLVGMWMAPVSAIVGVSGKGYPFKIGVVPLPRDATSFTVAEYEGLMISAATKSPQASWKLVNFLSAQAQPWIVPARLSLANSPAFIASMGKEQANGALAAMQNADLISSFDFQTLNHVIGIFSQATQAVIEGKATPAEALSMAQKEALK